MRLIDADRLLSDKMKSKYYHLPNGDVAIPIVDIEHAPTVGGWISVKDALPRPGEDVIVLMDMQDKGKWRILAYLDDEDEPEWTSGDELWEGEDDAGEHITHWMPLPEPPKEDDADD